MLGIHQYVIDELKLLMGDLNLTYQLPDPLPNRPGIGYADHGRVLRQR